MIIKLNYFLFLILFVITSLLSDDIPTKSKDIYIDYVSYPKRVFTGQKFDVKLKTTILINKKKYNKIVTTFIDGVNIDIETQEPIWTNTSENIFQTNITFKTQKRQFILPNITVVLFNDDKIIEFISIKPPKIKFERIAINQKLFSNIIASDLEIHTIKTKQYTNQLLLSTINIGAINSNLEDIKLNEFKEQGIKSLTEKEHKQNLFYYVIIPHHTKEIKFTYYNTVLKDFVTIRLPIVLKEERVSTQTDLNPYSSNILIYKQVLTLVILSIIIILFLFKQRRLYLIFIFMIIMLLGYLFIPNKKIVIPAKTKIYILPTQYSTIFRYSDYKELVEIINTKDNYIKVLFKNKNVGWIKK